MNFILFGAAGYVAPRHMKAIKENNGNLLAILDPHDSVGVIDRYFPECLYFQDFERLDRYVYKLLMDGEHIDYVCIASPNYLHDPQCRWGLRIGANVICEKPLVLTEENLDGLLNLENKNHIYGLYQLRYHDTTIELMNNILKDDLNRIDIDYNTPRGSWYSYSWKGYKRKSGGIETNIGCHLFDICTYFFGKYKKIDLQVNKDDLSVGVLYFDNATITWKLSTNINEPPRRVFKLNDVDYSFDSGFEDLHTKVYREIINGNGLSIENHRESIRICQEIRNRI
jgi:UDP-N-acetyl-2-amino-2-deoxyglucuronate dehydrogenase